MIPDWLHLFFPAINACILAYVVWGQIKMRRAPSIVSHCLITQGTECLLLRDPTVLCADCRERVVARAHESRSQAHE
jgi:hypothetical protein